MTIIEFLQARIAEAPPGPDTDAKGQIVQLYLDEVDNTHAGPGAPSRHEIRLGALADVCQLLAQGYAGHADYRPEWRPVP